VLHSVRALFNTYFIKTMIKYISLMMMIANLIISGAETVDVSRF